MTYLNDICYQFFIVIIMHIKILIWSILHYYYVLRKLMGEP